jgi:hypothetical protein
MASAYPSVVLAYLLVLALAYLLVLALAYLLTLACPSAYLSASAYL